LCIAQIVGKRHQRSTPQPDLGKIRRPPTGNVGGGRVYEVANQRIDHAPDGFVDQAAPANSRIKSPDISRMPRKQADIFQLLERDQPGAQSIVHVVIVVSDFVGQIADLRFHRGLRATDETFAQFAQPASVFRGTMLDDAFACLETQVKPLEGRVTLLEQVHRAQTLQIVLEPAVVAHAIVERVLSGVTKRGVSQVVRKRNRFNQILVELQGTRYPACNLRNLEAVCQTRTEQVALMIDEDLGLVFKAPERRGVHNSVPVALKFPAMRGL
jgi:hypothetical protein